MNKTTKLSGFNLVKTTSFEVPSDKTLSAMSCGLHRARLSDAAGLMPQLSDLFESAPVEHESEWFVDVKIHMLMKGQYPCIPNWHCDNVPRINRQTRYDMATDDKKMFLWLSSGPLTEAIAIKEPHDAGRIVKDHDDLRTAIAGLPVKSLRPRNWYSFSQLAPHRGTQATKSGWRVFCRLTHQRIASHRPVTSVLRRHAQVYLDAKQFAW